MEKIYDVVSMGEALIDFAEYGESGQGNELFEACPGGAPLNVMAMLDRLGHKTAYITKVGDDAFGRQLKETLDDLGTDTGNVVFDDQIPTTLAFIHTMPDGDREFSFYRKPGADMLLEALEVDFDLIRQAKVFHFGSLSMTRNPVRTTTKVCLKEAKEAGCLITFDPNLREMLWDSSQDAKEQMAYCFAHCDMLKISDDEVRFVSGDADLDKGIRYLQETYHIPVVFLTMGAAGSRAYTLDPGTGQPRLRVECPGFKVSTVDTTGAGDTFCACAIHGMLVHGTEDLTEETLREILRFGNAAAALVTTKKGAAKAMPDEAQVEALLKGGMRDVHADQ